MHIHFLKVVNAAESRSAKSVETERPAQEWHISVYCRDRKWNCSVPPVEVAGSAWLNSMAAHSALMN